MLSLYKVIDTMFPDMSNRVFQFVGSRPGEGTSTIVREFARIAAEQIGHRVLLVDADRYEGTQSKFYSVESQYSWIQALQESAEVGRAIHQVNGSNLFVSPAFNTGAPTPELFNSSKFDGFWANLKLNFDLVLIDSLPLTISPDALVIASKVDGVILVLEAEKTKWRTARHVKEGVERVGGNIIGIVFNDFIQFCKRLAKMATKK
jgi:capsular exopolysaccharide synthesis family protein